MAHTWDPARYLEYGDERSRPFVDLLARVGAAEPRTVVDLGCGTGNLTALLKRRWPAADVVGVDSSAEMIGAGDPSSGVRLVVGDLRDWAPDEPNYHCFSVDVEKAGYIRFGDDKAVLSWDPERGLRRLPHPG